MASKLQRAISNPETNGGSNADTETHNALQPSQTDVAGNTARQQPRRLGSHGKSATNSILARLNFLRTSTEHLGETPEESQPTSIDETAEDDAEAVRAPRPVKTRRRTGSLRKTALLGTGRFKAESKDRRGSQLKSPDGSEPAGAGAPDYFTASDHTTASQDVPIPTTETAPVRRVSLSTTVTSIPASDTPAPLSLDTSATSMNDSVTSLVSSTAKSPTDASNASTTTDDDEALTFSTRPAAPVPAPHKPSASSSASSSSYFPSPDVRRQHATGGSPLAALPMAYEPPLAEHSYSETEWWGWVVLVVTWLVFVIGMGSCLDVWSWAWAVGPKPYAPPELEDDPTLPIVGYYPTLIILTAVMAWVWVVVAWVGMKYFKHAKIPGDD